jgi:hypothetical protein
MVKRKILRQHNHQQINLINYQTIPDKILINPPTPLTLTSTLIILLIMLIINIYL